MGEEEHINLQSSALGLSDHGQHWQLWSTEPPLRAGALLQIPVCHRNTCCLPCPEPWAVQLAPACHAKGDW